MDGACHPGVLVAVDRDGVKCVVLPESSVVDSETGEPVPVDAGTAGLVHCLLWDPSRKVSLGLLDDRYPPLPNSAERAIHFESLLRDLHRDLTN